MRELENLIERGVLLAPNGGLIEIDHLFAGGAPATTAAAASAKPSCRTASIWNSMNLVYWSWRCSAPGAISRMQQSCWGSRGGNWRIA